VSLKTHYLTQDGVRQINDAVDTVGALINSIITAIDSKKNTDEKVAWTRAINGLGEKKCLLVIDNLETLGGELRELLVSVPAGSKVLLTSRIGLGELELRYDLPDYEIGDARKLFRALSSVLNYESLSKLTDKSIEDYCTSLDNNPLLIKWFILAVGKGADPNTLLLQKGFDAALDFCYANVYAKLSENCKKIISVILAARQILTSAQLQELSGLDHMEFQKAFLEIISSSIVGKTDIESSVPAYKIDGLVYRYLSANHPPDDRTVVETRDVIKKWKDEESRSLEHSHYRYDIEHIAAETPDQKISAPYLRTAIIATKRRDYHSAKEAVLKAYELTPNWGEVFRVKAYVFNKSGESLYETEDAFEQAIIHDDNDIARYHYTVYLLRANDVDKAFVQAENALKCPDALKPVLIGLKAHILSRMGKYDDAIQLFEGIWAEQGIELPVQIKRAQGTQYANALVRKSIQMVKFGAKDQVVPYLTRALDVLDDTIFKYYCDSAVVETVADLLRQVAGTSYQVELEGSDAWKKVESWDNHPNFCRFALAEQRIARHFISSPDLQQMMPNVYASACHSEEFEGKVDVYWPGRQYGYISNSNVRKIHFSYTSLKESRDWRYIKVGAKVGFRIVQHRQGPHAIALHLLR
jgi:LuxR family transcriptional regulator, glucitol operon activator